MGCMPIQKGEVSGGGPLPSEALLEKMLKWGLWPGSLPCSRRPTPREGPRNPCPGPPWGSYSAALAWPSALESEMSSAGQGACRGFTRQDTETASSHQGCSPELSHVSWQLAFYQVPSGGRRLCLLLPGESLFTSLSGLGTCYTSITQSTPATGHPPPRDCLPRNAEGRSGRDLSSPGSALLTLDTNPAQTPHLLPSLLQKALFPSFLLTSVQHRVPTNFPGVGKLMAYTPRVAPHHPWQRFLSWAPLP